MKPTPLRQLNRYGLLHGDAARIAKRHGISRSYLCDILNERRLGPEAVRKTIAKYQALRRVSP